ncbi:hypothetical protein ABE096_00200 [Robertmurraya massiliosenegalensis]
MKMNLLKMKKGMKQLAGEVFGSTVDSRLAYGLSRWAYRVSE